MSGNKVLIALLIIISLAIFAVIYLINQEGNSSSIITPSTRTAAPGVTSPQGDEPISEVCLSDEECGEGYFCDNGLCEPILY